MAPLEPQENARGCRPLTPELLILNHHLSNRVFDFSSERFGVLLFPLSRSCGGMGQEDVTQINSHRSGTQGVLNMVESKIYIGLNDLSTNTQLFENEKYIRVLRNVCYSYKVPFSFQVQEGGYIYESGEYARETSLVLTLIDVDKAVVKDIAKDLCAFFHQESVLVTESHLQAHFVRETLECGGEETL